MPSLIEHNGTQTILESIFIKYYIQENGFAALSHTQTWYIIIVFYLKTKIGKNVGKLEISQMWMKVCFDAV